MAAKRNKAGAARVLAVTVALAAIVAACQQHQAAPAPAPSEIESTAMRAAQQGDPGALRSLQQWAAYGLPVAQRELGLLYRSRPDSRAQALRMLEHAARSGDAEAAFALGESLRVAAPGVPAAPAAAWAWYKLAAERKHAKAALMMGQMARNGNGVPRDAAEAARWLGLASELGNAHAMFLLSNAYREGEGVARDAGRARALLEESAEHEYPPALQELAIAVQDEDALRSSHLLKEATEHRRNNWNRF
jgi:TPR repeat protein